MKFVLLWLFALASVDDAVAAIPGSERNALIELFQATDGDHWIVRDGWNGEAGTRPSLGEESQHQPTPIFGARMNPDRVEDE